MAGKEGAIKSWLEKLIYRRQKPPERVVKQWKSQQGTGPEKLKKRIEAGLKLVEQTPGDFAEEEPFKYRRYRGMI